MKLIIKPEDLSLYCVNLERDKYCPIVKDFIMNGYASVNLCGGCNKFKLRRVWGVDVI